MIKQESLEKIKATLINFPVMWDGKEAILEMRDNGYSQWRQMEWVGFYFEYLCNRFLNEIFKMPGPKYGNVRFDGFMDIPWDFKAHVLESGSKIIINDVIAIENAIQEYDSVGTIIVEGNANYNDVNSSFKRWHDSIKGKISKYEKERVARGAKSRRRKTSFNVEKILIIEITKNSLSKHGRFFQGRNADGSPRNPKLMMDLNNIEEELIETIIL